MLAIGLLASVVVWIVLWYWTTAAAMAGVWWRSDTFAHGMVVYPISLWLIWRKRATLAGLSFEPEYRMLGGVAAAGFGWILGTLAGVQAAQQLSLVVMIALAVWAIVGTRITRAIAFPLAFTLLAVPVGEFLLPILIEHTADFTVGALRLTGIPVYREGNNFVIPSGSWSVVEACSGLRYLIASVTLGLLYAYLTYSSPLRRALFVLASVTVPIVANWIRAYMIVMIGHLSSMKYAAGVDHIIYGWVFFGVVMLILFWIGSYWREDTEDRLAPARVEGQAKQPMLTVPVALCALLVAAVAAIAPTYAEFLDRRFEGEDGFKLTKPVGANGWSALSTDATAFRPHYTGSRARTETTFERDGRKVGLFIGYYARQDDGTELISFRNSITSGKDRQWRQLGQGRISLGDGDPDVVQTRVQGSDGEVVIWHWYWAGGRMMASPQMVKIRQAIDRLRGEGDDAAIVVMHAPVGAHPNDAGETLRTFVREMRPAIEDALEQTRRERMQDNARAIAGAS